jgi:hypothetical protein
MGVVYRARQLGLDRDVALKVISPERIGDAGSQARFLTEARAAAAVEHPHVVPIYGAGVEDGHAFLVMRYVPGEDLRTLVRSSGPLSADRGTAIGADVGGALDAIHRSGYVHRDVKPANILLDESGHVYLSDFGLARHILATSGPTDSDHWVGTVDFAAPEQIRGESVDALTDVYALGGVLYFMLTGQVPFEREDDVAKLWAHLVDDPPHLTDIRPDLPAALDDVVRRALSRQAADRQPSAGDLGRAAVAATHGGETRPERTVASGAASPGRAERPPTLLSGSETVAAGRRAPATRRWRRTVLAGGAGVALVGAAAGVLLALSKDGASPTPPAPAASLPRVAETIDGVGSRPRAIAVAGGSVWVVSHDRRRVSRFDASTGRRTGRQPRIGIGGWSIAGGFGSLWVAAPDRGRVLRLDPSTGRVMTQILPPAAPFAAVPERDGVWVATRSAAPPPGSASSVTPGLLLRYGGGGGLRYRVPIARGIRAVAVGGGSVWVSVSRGARILELSGDGRHVRRRILLPQPANALTYGAGHLWASLPTHNAVVRVDRRGEPEVTSRVGASPAQMAVVGDSVFVACNTDHRVDLLDVDTGRRRRRSLAMPANPYAVTAAAGDVWVTGLGNTVTRIET